MSAPPRATCFGTDEIFAASPPMQIDCAVYLAPRAHALGLKAHATDLRRPGKGDKVLFMNFTDMFRSSPAERVLLVERGVPAKAVRVMAKRMAVPEGLLIKMLGLSHPAIDRKMHQDVPLSSEEGSRVLGMGSLIGQVQVMVEESGNPEGFNAAEWTAAWLDRPVPALGGRRPGELMDTFDGQALVSDLVARMQTGAYS